MHTDNFNIIKKLKEGDKEAYMFLYRQYYTELCSYAFHLTKDVKVSEDIVQEIILKIWEKRETLKIPEHLKEYLFKAVHNGCLNHFRHLKIKNKHALYVLSTETEELLIRDSVEEQELSDRIDIAVEALNKKQKEIFKMSRYEGLKYKEIAEKKNCTVKNVEYHMCNSLHHIMEYLKDYLT